MVPAPREFAERIFNVQQWTEMPRGGHFTAMEQPELFAEDIRKFAKNLKAKADRGHTVNAGVHQV
jgi:microsomal epoxide hydrolase